MQPSAKYSFGGGWVTSVAKTRLQPHQLIRAKNVNILIDGEFEVRGGCALVSEVAFGTTIDRFVHFKTDNYDKIVAYGGEDEKRLDVNDPDEWTLLDDAMPDTDDYRAFAIANDMLYIGALDTAGVRKYYPDEDILWPAGIMAPATAVTLTQGEAGSPSGDYYYYWTYYNSVTEEESDPSPLSAKITVVGKIVILDDFVISEDLQVDKIRIYRNPHGVTQYFYIGEKLNDTETYLDDTGDDEIGESEVSFRNAPPPASAVFLWHLNRMFYAEGNTLWWSEPFKPGSVHATSYQIIEQGDGGKIVALAVSYENLIVFKNTGNFLFLFNTDEPLNSTYNRLAYQFICVAPLSVCHLGEDVIFLSSEGLKVIVNAGTQIQDIRVPITTEDGTKSIDPIINIFRECKPEAIHKSVGIYYEDKDQYCISVPYFSTNNDLTVVYHRMLGAYSYHKDWIVKHAAPYREYEHDLLYRTHNDAYIYRHDYGMEDVDQPISFDVQTGWHDVSGTPDFKNIRLVFPTIRGADGAVVNYEILKDFESTGDSASITHQGASYWGYAHWGQNYWCVTGEVEYRKEAYVKGRRFSTRFHGMATQKVGVAAYQFFFQPKSL